MKPELISMMVVRRLPRYYRFLSDMEAMGITKISSGELAKRMNLTASQIRQDLNCFGGFGQQGYGYHIPTLREKIGEILGIDRPKKAILLGAGNMGRALAGYTAFERKGLYLAGIFDADSNKVGESYGGLTVQHTSDLAKFCKKEKPEAAVICVGSEAAKMMCNQLVQLGIRGFVNFSRYDILADHPDVMVQNVHIGDAMLTLSYQMCRAEELPETAD